MHATPRATALALLLTAGCAGKTEDTGDELIPQIVGSIQPDGAADAGNVRFYKAFAFDQGGAFLAYLSSSPKADCTTVGQYLRVGAEPYDPEAVFAPETCNMFIKIAEDYDGGIDYTRTARDVTIDTVGTGTAIECALGAGSFELTALENGEDDYYYSGRWWVGNPLTYRYTFSGSGEDGYTMEIELSQLDGGFVQESLEEVRATAEVNGTISAEYCTDLASTGLF